MVAAPACQLQAHSSSDWRASSWRRTSSVLRPTESAVTETDWMTLWGSMMKVARSASPVARLMPRASVSSRLRSLAMGKGRSWSLSWLRRQA